MSATIKDICRATGFSTATVSRVLNNSPLVTEETKKRVQQALDRLGYQPHHAARSLKLNRTGMIAVVFPELDNGFFTDVLRGIDEMASEFGTHLLTAFTHGPLDEEELIARMVRERRADSIILMNLTLKDAFLNQIQQWDMPVVLIDRPLKKSGLVSVGIDNRGGAAAMTQHLIDAGHRDFIFIGGPRDTFDAQERLLAFRKVMKLNRLPVPASAIWSGDFTEAGGYRLMSAHLAANRPLPDVIFAANDALAVGAHRALREHGIKVPEQVALAGFDDTDLARHLDLTTVHVPMRMIGREAARQALELLEGRSSQKHMILPTRLVVRRSSARIDRKTRKTKL
ncbi:MAG TPA: LacI family DNA-binding transcriptional regulator [Kiritimatiellia bacterium]|nr:LacI family DNA-binding transcriptional regulator [Kiritimatiellia bacterium]